MKFNCSVPSVTVHIAAKLVAEHFKDEAFLHFINIEKKFNHTTHSGMNVANKIVALMPYLEIDIVPYKTRLPWSRVIGYAAGNTIYVNTRKLDLPMKDRVENIMHECLHLIGYSHKGNKVNEYNLNTVPYKVANIFANYIEAYYDERLNNNL